MQHEIIVECGNPFGSSKIEISGLNIKDSDIPVLIDFNPVNIISKVKPYIKDGSIRMMIEVSEENAYLNPAVGVKVIESIKEGSLNIVKKSELMCIGLCDKQNDDPAILNIASQIELQKL